MISPCQLRQELPGHVRGLATGPRACPSQATPARFRQDHYGVSSSASPAPSSSTGTRGPISRLVAAATQPGFPAGERQSPDGPGTLAEGDQYHRTMQELLQKRRRATMERQAAAQAAAAGAAAAPAAAARPPPSLPPRGVPHRTQPPASQLPPSQPPPPQPPPQGHESTPRTSAAPSTPAELPRSWPQPSPQGPGGRAPGAALESMQDVGQPELPAAASLAVTLPHQNRRLAAFGDAPVPGMEVAALTSAVEPRSQLQPQAQAQAQAHPRRGREPPSPKPLPNLLSGLSSPQKASEHPGAAAGAVPGIGLDILPRSSRSTPVAGIGAGGGGGGGGFIGSTRSAKAALFAPTALQPSKRAWNEPYTRDSNSSGGTGGGGGRVLMEESPAQARGFGGPPMAQRTPLSLNANMACGSPATGAVRQSPVPAAAPAQAATASAASAPGGSSPGGGIEGATTDRTASKLISGATAGGAATGAATKPKSTRRAALWLSSFVQAAGRTGGSGGMPGPAPVAAQAAAASAAATAAAAKQPAPDAGAAAVAMVRAAACRPARDLGEAVTDLPATIPELQARLEAVVQAEQESEMRALRALYASGSLRQLQREGVVLVGLWAAEAGRLYRSTLWRFSLLAKKGSGGGAATQLPYHKLRPGASVIITPHMADNGRSDGAAARVDSETGIPSGGVEGVVVEAQKDHLVVALEGRSHDTFQTIVSELARPWRGGAAAGGLSSAAAAAAAAGFLGWRLDQSVRDTTTRRHLEGIRRLGAWSESSEDARLGEARVRAVLAGSRSASLLAAEPPEWVKEDRWREDARAALAAQQGLNDSQRRAVAAALTRTVTLWQGPPGTGKTRTLLALIEILVRVRAAGKGKSTGPANVRGGPGAAGRKCSVAGAAGSSPRAEAMGPVLAVADTNAAVDNLVEGLAARGVAAVRLGPAAKARESLRHLSLEAQAEATPLGRKAVALRTQALRKQEEWRQVVRPGGASGMDAAGVAAAARAAEVRADLERAEAALREAAASVVASAEVVVATCTAAGDSILDGRPWKCVVVDEASQATEPSVLVALTRGSAFVVMAGDPRQLPPTVMSEAALQYGLDVTLFERVAGAGGVTPLLLDTQYRMHPAISAFPSAFFYGGKLRDGVEAADKPVPKGFPWPKPAKPLALVQVAAGREETSGGIAELAAAAASGSSSGSGSGRAPAGPDAVAAVPPPRGSAPRSGDRASYRNPAEALLALAVTQQLLASGDITSAAILTPYRGQVRLIEALTRQRGLEAGWAAAGLEVAVSTVDGYQGREADVVVFSAVRANDRGAVGFLSDPRRMNVAITRPRRGLVVLADTGTLTRGSADWGTYVKWARGQGVVVPAEDVIDVEAALGGGQGAASAAGAARISLSDEEDSSTTSTRTATTGSSSSSSSSSSTSKSNSKSISNCKASPAKARARAPGDALPLPDEVDEKLLEASKGASRRGKRTGAAAAAAAAAAVLESSELEEADGDDEPAASGPAASSEEVAAHPAAAKRGPQQKRQEKQVQRAEEESSPKPATRRRRTSKVA